MWCAGSRLPRARVASLCRTLCDKPAESGLRRQAAEGGVSRASKAEAFRRAGNKAGGGAGTLRRKKGSSMSLASGLATAALGLGTFGAWLGLDEGELASGVREQLYNTKLGDVYKFGAVNLDEMTKGFTEPSSEKLIPDWPMSFPPTTPQPMTLVVDLEETLVHPSFDRKYGWRHAKRPGVDKFLEALSCLKKNDETGEYQFRKMYEIVIFTSSLQHTAQEVITLLDNKNIILHKIFREGTTFKNGKFVKDLSKLNRDLNRVIIIDDEPESYMFQPENAIAIKPFDDPSDKDDSALVDLIPFLQALARDETPGRDVRQVLARYQGKNIAQAYLEETVNKLASTIDRREKGIGGAIRAGRSSDFNRGPAPSLGITAQKRLETGEVYMEEEKSMQEMNQLLARTKKTGGFRSWLQSRSEEDEERQQLKMQQYQDMMEKRAREKETR